MPSPSRWLTHTPMTELAALSPSVERLPSEVADLNRVVQGLLVHCDWLGLHADDPSVFGPVSRATLPAGQRLAAILERDGRALDVARLPTRRAVGTCRDFALMMTAFLRTKGTAARLRCGFAAYLGDGWVDHWVCEYWSGRESRWCLSDAQIDDAIRAARGVTFDAANVPRDAFLTAGEAWLRCRAGRDDPERFANGGTKGRWYMKVNVVRDALVVNNRETSAWDTWRDAPPELRTVSPGEIAALDRLSRNPEGALDLVPPDLVPPDLVPPWLAAKP